MLHLRCGDDILHKLDAAGLPGRKVSWSDPLCEGPVTSADRSQLRPVRAAWLKEHFGVSRDTTLADLEHADRQLESALGEDEVVLWFEADLFDQAILVYVLTVLAPARERLRLVTLHAYPGVHRFVGLGQLGPRDLASLFEARIPVSDDMVGLAREAWTAWTAPTPEALAVLARRDSQALPYLAAAVTRLLQELPDVRTGLARSVGQGLGVIRDGATSLHEAFSRSQDLEERPWAGDAMFYANLHPLAHGAAALIEVEGGWASVSDARKNPRVRLTAAGRDVLEGRVDWWPRPGTVRWVAGTELGEGKADWRWDRAGGLVRR